MPECEKFNSFGWCNCHNKFNVKIGISEGRGIIYKDFNQNYNLAGSMINMASRLLSEANRNQILLTQEAYKQIIDLVTLTDQLNGLNGISNNDNEAGIVQWGTARKCVNLLIRSVVYNGFMWEKYDITPLPCLPPSLACGGTRQQQSL